MYYFNEYKENQPKKQINKQKKPYYIAILNVTTDSILFTCCFIKNTKLNTIL